VTLIKKRLMKQYDKEKTQQIMGTMGGLTLKDAFNVLAITKARDADKVEPEGLVKTKRAKQRSRHDRGIGRGLRSSAGRQ
jgi:hypothetical protein